MKDWGTYRKLFENPPPAFERLPFAIRCMAAEVIRRCDRIGRIVPGEALTDELAADLAFHVRAHPSDAEFIRAGLSALLADGYLEFRDHYLTIRNFAKAQSSTSAERMAVKRARDRGEEPSLPSHLSPVTSDNSDGSRARSSRLVDLSSGSPEGEAGEGPAPSGYAGETPCPPDLAQTLDGLGVVAELAKALNVRPADVRAALGEFVSYWTIGAGAGDRRAHWPKRAREQVRKLHQQGRLAGMGGANVDPAERAAQAAELEAQNRASVARERAATRAALKAGPLTPEQGQAAVASVLAQARAQSVRGGGQA